MGEWKAVYEGRWGAVEELLTWTRGRDPRWAQVTGVDIRDEETDGEPGFSRPLTLNPGSPEIVAAEVFLAAA